MSKKRIKFEFLVHDLKVPLAIIEAGITSLIEREEKYGPLTEKQTKVLKRALRNTLVTKSLVNDALELGKSHEGVINKRKFSISTFIEKALVEAFDLNDGDLAEDIRRCKKLEDLKIILEEKDLLLHIDEGFWRQKIKLDESKVTQIVRNLLNNALKYCKKRVDLGFEKKEGSLIVTVKDDGDGIPKDYHQKIFECYFQMDMEKGHCVRGHGLGLAGVMVLVEDMGGRLDLHSDVGKGATFSVQLPI